MERIIFDRMAANDQTHWWYVARRHILSSLIARRAHLPRNARILEIGCGTGHNFAMLGAFGHVDALEIDEAARKIASAVLGREVGAAALPELTGVEDEAYDLIALLDVLEHVEADEATLMNMHKKLKPNGKILVTVPANKWMWSAHDVLNHHYRRYTRTSLQELATKAGLKTEMMSYFNTVLFPLAAAFRIIGKITGRKEADDEQPQQMLNTIFTRLFGFERHLIGRLQMPFGVSLVAILT